jgi:hypothetical protein
LWAAAEPAESRQTLAVQVAVEPEQWLFILHSVWLGPCRLLLALELHQQRFMIAGQTEAHQASALLLLLAAAAAVIGVIMVVKVPCHRAPKSQVLTVVLVVVLAAVFPILLVETLQFSPCQQEQSPMETRVVMLLDAVTVTQRAVVEQVRLVEI